MLKSNIFRSSIRYIFSLFILGILVACNPEELSELFPNTVSGSVGDGPITGAQISVTDSTGAVVGIAISDNTANYTVSVAVGSAYPVLVTATGGTDTVSSTTPDFILLSVAESASVKTVNINPFSTLIVKTAQAMSGGMTEANISVATQYIMQELHFGLDPFLVPDPIKTPINNLNVAAIIKSSEALAEALRRTSTALLESGLDITEDTIISTIALDMVDGVLDGRGQGADARIAATTNIVSAQVLIESLVNQLVVNGTDATQAMDDAILLSLPSATMTTADVLITDGMLNQARTTTAAAQALTPNNANLSAVALILSGLGGNNVLAADIDAAFPTNPSADFDNVITQLSTATVDQLDSVNDTVRAGGGNVAPDPIPPAPAPAPPAPEPIPPRAGAFEFSTSTYSVAESGGTVTITINRVGGSAGVATVQWRTLTLNGFGTADWANDYVTFPWTSLTFNDGETSKVETIVILSDTVSEADETFSVQIQNPTNGTTLGSITSTVVTIIDDDIDVTPAPAPEPPPPAPAPGPSPTPLQADYYVAPNGRDTNPGTIDLPFATVAKAISMVKQGELVYFRGGTYPINHLFNVSGTSTNPITYEGYPGETVIFDGSNITPGSTKDRIAVKANWNVFRNFEVRYSPNRGIWIENGHDNVFENILTHHNYNAGLQIFGGNRNLVINVTSHSNYDPGTGGENGDGMSISNGVGNTFRNCLVYNNSDDGIDLWRSTNSTVEDSISHNNGVGTNGNGNGYKLGGNNTDMTIGGHIVRNNIAYQNRSQGFSWNGGYSPNTIYNNTSWNNGSWNYNFGGGDHVLRNNLSFSGTVNMGTSNDQSNSWNLNINDPQFKSVDPTSPVFLEPGDNSPVIDRGDTSVANPYLGNAPDLGAKEVR